MATKKVKVKQFDANEVTKLQIIAGIEGGVPLFSAHERREDRVKVPDGTQLEVVDAFIRGSGASNPNYYYIADVPANGNYRRYFIKAEDVQ